MGFDRELRVRSDVGTELWVGVAGRGPAVVLCDGLGCDGFIWKYILPDLARDHQVIRWHYRAHGYSDVPPDLDDLNVPGFARDLWRVLDTLGVESAALAGHSMGVQVILEAALQAIDVRARDRVDALVCLCGAPGRPLDTFKNTSLARHIFPVVRRVADRAPEPFRAFWKAAVPSRLSVEVAKWFETNRHLVHISDVEPYLHRLSDMDPRAFLATVVHAGTHDASSSLDRLDMPALVVAAERDSFTPIRLSRRMSEQLRSGELFVLPDATHTGPLEWPELLNLRWRKFERERVLRA